MSTKTPAAPPQTFPPFGKIPLTQTMVRHFANGAWGPKRTEGCEIAAGGKGLVITGYQIPPDHCLCLAFPVGPENQLPDYWKMVNELAGGGGLKKFRAAICTDTHGGHQQGYYDGRQTTTDQPFGQYVHASSPNQSNVVLHLGAGTYFLFLDIADNTAGEAILGHQGSN